MRTRCLWCDKEIEKGHSLISVLTRDLLLCGKCERQFRILNDKFKVLGVRVWALYEYNEFMSSILIQYKECFDEALCEVFLQKYYQYISIKYKGYTLVAIPSSDKKYQDRGFHHVKRMFEKVKLPWCDCLVKISEEDQKKLSLNKRKEVKLGLVEGVEIPSKILVVDDVYTTGSTIKKALELLKHRNRYIKVLVVSKVVEKSR